MGSVGIAEGYVDAGEFFILKDVSDDVLDSDVGSDGELSYAVGVGVGMGVGPEVALEVLVRGGDAGDAVALDVDRQGSVAEDAVAGAEVVADYSVDDEDSVDLRGGGEALAAGEVSPLLGADDLGGDVDHVGVAHAAAIDYVRHLHAAAEFVGLDLDGEDADLRALHVGEDGGGHLDEGPGRDAFQHECVPGAADLFELACDGGGDGEATVVRDERGFFAGLDLKAGGDGVARAGRELRRKFYGEKVNCCLHCSLINHGVHLSGETYY